MSIEPTEMASASLLLPQYNAGEAGVQETTAAPADL